jgi:ATP-binding cassette subfamily B protein
MTSRKKISRSNVFRSVFVFVWRYWRRQPLRLAMISVLIVAATLADVLTPYYAGQIVDAVASGTIGEEAPLASALTAFGMLIALGLGALILRFFFFRGIIDFTLSMMKEIVGESFFRVQRFSTDWHANTFAGSTVRKMTRGMWAVDIFNDTILMAMLPSVVMLVGTTALLAAFWPLMGLVIGLGSLAYIVLTAVSPPPPRSPIAGTRGRAVRSPMR